MKKLKIGKMPRERLLFPLQAALLLFVSAWLGFIASFPNETLKDYIEEEIRAKASCDVDIEGLSVSFPFSLKAEHLAVEALPLPLAMTEVKISPSLVSCLRGRPALLLSGLALGGEVEGEVFRNGDFSLKGRALDLNAVELPALPVRLSGTVRNFELFGTFPPETSSENLLNVRIENLVASGLKPLGLSEESLPFGNLAVSGRGKGRTFRLEEFKTEDGVVDVVGSGSILLASSVGQTRMKLRFDINPLPGTPQDLLSLIDLFSGGMGAPLALSVDGPLERPSVNPLPATKRSARRVK